MRQRPTHEEMMEIFDLSLEIFEPKIEAELTVDDAGKNIAIDVDTGEWAVGEDSFLVLKSKNNDPRIINMYYPYAGPYAVGATVVEDE